MEAILSGWVYLPSRAEVGNARAEARSEIHTAALQPSRIGLSPSRIQTILQRIANEIESEDGQHNCKPWIRRKMRSDQQKLPSFIQHGAPGRRWRLDPQSQEAQAALGNDRRGQSKGSLDEQRREEIRKQVSHNDTAGLATERLRSANK